MQPLVSVIMPVRDGGEYLLPAVRSILDQTYSSFELLLVDDHSIDGALAELPLKDDRMVVLTARGHGVSRAFNDGLSRAQGTFVARMDADDVAMPFRLERQLAYFREHPEVDICGACVELFSEAGIAGGNRRYEEWLNRCISPAEIARAMFIESPIPNPTAMFRKASLDQLGGYQDPPWPEDYDLFLRADAAGMKMGKPSDCLLRWREHDERLTRTDTRYSRTNFQAAKAHYLATSRIPGDVPLVLWGAGPGGRLMHDLLQDEGRSITGFLDVHPRRIGGQKRGLPVWAVEELASLHDAFVLVAVGSAGVRPKIREFLNEHGRKEGRDYLFAA